MVSIVRQFLSGGASGGGIRRVGSSSNVGDALVKGGEGLVSGVFKGVTGVFTKPIEV